jgi:hypothetical protein
MGIDLEMLFVGKLQHGPMFPIGPSKRMRTHIWLVHLGLGQLLLEITLRQFDRIKPTERPLEQTIHHRSGRYFNQQLGKLDRTIVILPYLTYQVGGPALLRLPPANTHF